MGNGMSTYMPHSKLFYRGTNIEVAIGDRVLLKLWFGLSRKHGVVCYIPGISPLHSAIGDAQWAIKTDDGTVYAMGYSPDEDPVVRGTVFLGRGEGSEIGPDEGLE